MVIAFIVFYIVAMAIIITWWSRSTSRRVSVAEQLEISIPEEILRRIHQVSEYRAFGEGEHWFLQRAVFWDRPCLDTTYFGYEALRAIKDLTGQGHHGDWIREYGDNLREFVRAHFDDTLGGFKYCTESRHASLYGTFVAVALLKSLNGFKMLDDRPCAMESLVQDLGRDQADATLEFIRACYSETGGFGENIYKKNKPTVVDTDIAIILLRNFERTWPEEPMLKAVPDWLMSTFKRPGPQGSFGFSNVTKEVGPLSCATHFALRAFHNTKGIDSTFQPEQIDQVGQFILHCSNEDGGFSARPGGPSSLAYTYLSLIDLDKYFPKFCKKDDHRLNGKQILDFVEISRRNGGYVLEPSIRRPPDVHATRAALEVLKRLPKVCDMTVDLAQINLDDTVAFILEELGSEGGGVFKGFHEQVEQSEQILKVC